MRIAALETIPVGLPFARTYVTASGRLDSREMLIVRLAADDGAIGWGDAVPMSLRGGPGLASVRADIENRCAAALIGHDYEADPDRFIAAALDRCRLAGAGRQALSAVDVALVDLIGKHEGEPAWRVLGAAAGGPVACNATIGADSADQAAAAAAAAVRGGFGTVKVKAGDERDVERIRAVCGAAGAGMRLRIDANGAWTAAEAVRRLGELEPLDLELAEQPCPTAPELAEVRSATGVPNVADESVNDLDEARAAPAIGAFDAATLKLAKVGGPHAALAIAAAVPAYLSSALDSALGIAAAAHTARAMPQHRFASGLAHGLATSPLFADNVADDGMLTGPEIVAGDLPGLGVTVDEGAIERLRLR